MELVADTNIVAAAILRPGLTRNLMFNPELALYSPERLVAELDKHEKEFLEKSGLSTDQYRQAVALVLAQVSILPAEMYSHHALEAKEIAPDKSDWPFFAVALHKKCGIWSNEKRLKLQDKARVISTEELLNALTQ